MKYHEISHQTEGLLVDQGKISTVMIFWVAQTAQIIFYVLFFRFLHNKESSYVVMSCELSYIHGTNAACLAVWLQIEGGKVRAPKNVMSDFNRYLGDAN